MASQPSLPPQLTLKGFIRMIAEQATGLTRLIDPKKRFRQEKVQIVVLTAITAGFCLLGAYVIYGIGK